MISQIASCNLQLSGNRICKLQSALLSEQSPEWKRNIFNVPFLQSDQESESSWSALRHRRDL